MLTVIFSVIGTFQLFNEPALMRTLAPTVIGTDWTPNWYAYNIAFVNQDANCRRPGVPARHRDHDHSYVVQLSSQRRERHS